LALYMILKLSRSGNSDIVQSITVKIFLKNILHLLRRCFTYSDPEIARNYREARPRGYCVQCTRRAINSIVKTIEEFAS
jgi:hypothetical protein